MYHLAQNVATDIDILQLQFLSKVGVVQDAERQNLYPILYFGSYLPLL